MTDDDIDDEPVVDEIDVDLDEDYVVKTCEIAVMSNYACLPRPGGLDDQDEQWVNALFLFLSAKRRADWERRNPKLVAVIEREDNAPNWKKALGIG